MRTTLRRTQLRTLTTQWTDSNITVTSRTVIAMEATAKILVDTKHHVGAMDEAETTLRWRRRLRNVAVEVHHVGSDGERGDVVWVSCNIRWSVDSYPPWRVCERKEQTRLDLHSHSLTSSKQVLESFGCRRPKKRTTIRIWPLMVQELVI